MVRHTCSLDLRPSQARVGFNTVTLAVHLAVCSALQATESALSWGWRIRFFHFGDGFIAGTRLLSHTSCVASSTRSDPRASRFPWKNHCLSNRAPTLRTSPPRILLGFLGAAPHSPNHCAVHLRRLVAKARTLLEAIGCCGNGQGSCCLIEITCRMVQDPAQLSYCAS